VKLVGYADRLSVAPGETIRFMVSSAEPRYDAAVVRLIHGDPDPQGPGRIEPRTPMPIDGEYPGRVQGYRHGSYVVVPHDPCLEPSVALTVQAWIFPTTPSKGVQGIVTKWDQVRSAGWGLVVDGDGAVALRLGDGRGRVAEVSSGRPLRAFEWTFVAATWDASIGRVSVEQLPVRRFPNDPASGAVEQEVDVAPAPTGAPLVLAALDDLDAGSVKAHFNGKIDTPRVFGLALERENLQALALGWPPDEDDTQLLAWWDLSREISSDRVVDVAGRGLHGHTVNMPMRAVTGWNWSGDECDPRHTPEQYGAIFFHDDDLVDAGWDVDFELEIPSTLRSGIYAVRLRADDEEDHVPFFVRPPRGTATARIAFLVPTLSYLAYANEHQNWAHPSAPASVRERIQPQDHYSTDNRLNSLYDHHPDGTGVCYASRLRPMVNMRPFYEMALAGCPHEFPADLHLVAWLEAKGFEYDVITDEDLHHEGRGLLEPYRVVLTGSHPEYWTRQMLEGMEGYQAEGGRVMYLGGNGFYWVTSIDPARPEVIEVRRGKRGTGSWRSAVGEYHHSTTGELGGLWRDRGREPQKLVGVGMAAQGFDKALPFRREPGSFDPRAAFVFEGVATDETIGDRGLDMGGAGGLELDRLDYALGTPPHALPLASVTGFSDSYQHVVEEVETSDSKQGGSVSPFVRSDMVFFELPNGGAVFSASSIAWCGSLVIDGYENAASRITENVLRRFSSDEAF
jgi:N,N-dimethylformamidase